jgi:hypothetical protein
MAAKKTTAKKTTRKPAKGKSAPSKKKVAKKGAAPRKIAKAKADAKPAKKEAKKQTVRSEVRAPVASGATAPVEKKPPNAAPSPKPAGAKSGFSSLDVNMGHVFALRPRVPTSFRPDDFRMARQLLEEQSFANAVEAARAVAEKALELSQGDAVPGRGRQRLF